MNDSTSPVKNSRHGGTVAARFWLPLPLFALQPILSRIVRRIGVENPGMFNRLGPHIHATYIIDPTNMPFQLLLEPNPQNLILRAISNRVTPAHDARIAGKFMDLLRLMDAELDGDALFFARELDVTGNTEAVVCLRNALDDVDGSIAERVAALFGSLGRAALASLRRGGPTPKTANEKI